MRVIIIAMLMALSFNVYATQGGEGNNTGCNGQGNPNSPCEGNDNGVGTYGYPRGVGEYGAIDARSDASASAGASSSSDNNVTITEEASDLRDLAPPIAAPSMGVVGGEYSCLKAYSGGISLPGFGGVLGGMKMDKNCDARVTAKLLYGFGLSDHAIQVLCQLPSMREADNDIAKAYGVAPKCLANEPDSTNDHNIW
jgi:hypothetical protein